ncbi:MAG: copper chaperone PCu(A)C [Tepidiforma sp.]|jgi:copper(I)-binding protein
MTTLLRSRAFLPILLLGAFAVALLAAACGGDDDDASATPTATQGAGSGTAFQPVKAGDLTISGAWVRASTGTNVTAAYMTIKSSGAADTLVSASSPIAGMVQLHEVVTEGSTSKMQEKPGGFPVPANGTAELKPGGWHIMLMDLKQQPKAGETVELTLKFEKAGEVKIVAPVQAASGSTPDMSHDSHGGSSMTPSGGMSSGMGGTATPAMGR